MGGDGSLFVGSDELIEAWRIFTPLLQEIDAKKPSPVVYPFGSRVPPGMDEFAKKYGVSMQENLMEYLSSQPSQSLRQTFDAFDKDKDGYIDATELSDLIKHFNDGRPPSASKVAQMLQRIDKNGDGKLDF